MKTKRKITSTKLIFVGHCALTVPALLIFSIVIYFIGTAIITPVKEIGVIGLAISWAYWVVASEAYILWALQRDVRSEILISAARSGWLPITQDMIKKVASAGTLK